MKALEDKIFTNFMNNLYLEKKEKCSHLIVRCSSKKIVNGGFCVVDGFIQGGVVVCSFKECVIN